MRRKVEQTAKESTDERIRRRAYEIWEAKGRPEGRDHEHWHEARAELAGPAKESASAAKPSTKASTKTQDRKPAQQPALGRATNGAGGKAPPARGRRPSLGAASKGTP
jgi:hypothetical protein